MKTTTCGLLLSGLFVAGTISLGSTTVQGEQSPWKWTPEAVADTVAVANVTVSPDGGSVVFSRSRWRSEDATPGPAWSNLWLVPFAGGDPRRLTMADGEDSSPRFSPDGSRLAFLAKRGDKDAKTRVLILPLAGGESSTLTDEKTDVAAFAWSPDGSRIAYLAVDRKSEEKEKEEKAGKDWKVADQDLRPRRLWIVEVASGEARPLASLGELSAWDFDWAPDGSALVAAVSARNRVDDSYMLKRLVVLPLAGERRELVPVVGKIEQVAWSKDGKTIAWLGGVDASDPSPGSLFVVPAAGGQPRNLSGAREETAQSIFWRPDGRLAVSAASGTRSVAHLVDPARETWETVVFPGPVAFSGVSWSRDGSRAAFAGSTSASPPDVYAVSLAPAQPAAPLRTGKTKRKKEAVAPPQPSSPPPPRRLVSSHSDLDPLPRATQETIRWQAKDGLEIEGVVIRPAHFSEGTRYPLVVIVHGGPESHYSEGWLNSYHSPGQALAERGFFVLFPNYRGSTGRGVAYAKADHEDLGGKEFTDVLDGVDFLVAKGWVDAKRVGIMGGSYGGYFTALGVTRYSERFAAGVNFFGISSWESFLGQTDIPAENSLVHWALWCYEHVELCRERSAIGNLERARTPVLILQGADDERVPKPQSDELYAALRWKKVPVEYVIYPREGHGFRERAHRLDALSRLLGWLEKYLKPGP